MKVEIGQNYNFVTCENLTDEYFWEEIREEFVIYICPEANKFKRK